MTDLVYCDINNGNPYSRDSILVGEWTT